MGPAAKPALPRLIEAAQNDPDPKVRANAMRAVANFTAGDQKLESLLLDLLRDNDNRGTRLAAVSAFGQLGPDGAVAVPELIKILGEPQGDDLRDRQLRLGTLLTLKKIGPAAKDAIPVLLDILTNGELRDSMRCGAAEALSQIGVDRAEVLSALQRTLEETDSPNVRSSVQEALKTLKK